MDKNGLISAIKKMILCMAWSGLTMAAGLAVTSFLVSSEIMTQDKIKFGVYGTLMISTVISCLVADRKRTGNTIINALIGVVAVMLLLIVGNIFVCDEGMHNIPGTVLVLISGAVMMILLKKKGQNTVGHSSGKRKMVNLYKKRTR